MMAITEIREWIRTLDETDSVYIDDGGLTLRSDLDPDAYLEIGGHPEDGDTGDQGQSELNGRDE